MESRGFKIPAKLLFDFFYEVKPPLGFDKEKGHDKKFVAREIMSMNLFGLLLFLKKNQLFLFYFSD